MKVRRVAVFAATLAATATVLPAGEWQQVHPRTELSGLVGIAHDGGRWVAVGADGEVLESPDGLQWEVTGGVEGLPNAWIAAVAAGGGVVVVVSGPAAERIAWFLDDAHVDVYRRQLGQILQGASPPAEPDFAPGPNDTTHISVVDGSGLLVSVTTSAGENAGYVVGDTGVCLNNMLGEADLHPQGFHRWPAGARLHTMMTPAVVVKDEQPVLAVGSGGSNRIRSAILQVLSNVIDFNLPLDLAVNAPRIHFEQGVLQAEGGISAAAVQSLRDWGYVVNHWPDRNMFFGGAHAVGLQDGELAPAGDARRGGSTALVC